MKRFKIYSEIKKNAIRVLITAGLSCRESISALRSDMPYLFEGKSFWENIDSGSV